MTSENRRRFFRAQITAPARWQMLGEEERRLLDQGLGRALLDQVELPSPIDEFMEQAAPDSEEAHLFRSLQFINSKLDFMINQLFLKPEQNLHQAKVIEMSGSGMRFLSEEELHQGALIRMAVIMPGSFRFQIELIAEVSRIESEGNRCLAAVEIVEIDEESRDAIVKAVLQKQRKDIRMERESGMDRDDLG